MTRPEKAKAIERLQKVLDTIPELKKLSRGSPEFTKWRRDVEVVINNTFGDEKHQADFGKISFSLRVLTSGTPESKFQEAYLRGLASAESVLQSMVDEIEEYWEDDGQSSCASHTGRQSSISKSKVFVIHGHDDSARESVARFLEKLDLEPIVLHEQPNKGRTIIEKFEDHADVGFAVVLLTPDDEGALTNNQDKPRPRARQNVIFELGFFIGKLGRDRVCPFVKGDVETPSDYDGIVYTRLDDSGGWKTKLIQELKAVDYDIDANRLFS